MRDTTQEWITVLSYENLPGCLPPDRAVRA